MIGFNYKAPTRKLVKAVAMDKNKTQQVYTLTDNYIVPVVNVQFDYNAGKDKVCKKYIRFWKFDGLNKGCIIMGRPGLRTLGIGLIDRASFKRAIYFHQKGENPSVLPSNDEDMNILFGQLNYRYNGEPGIRRMHYKDNIIELVDDIKQSQPEPQVINVLNAYPQQQNQTESEEDIKLNEFLEEDEDIKLEELTNAATPKDLTIKYKYNKLEEEGLESPQKQRLNKVKDQKYIDEGDGQIFYDEKKKEQKRIQEQEKAQKLSNAKLCYVVKHLQQKQKQFVDELKEINKKIQKDDMPDISILDNIKFGDDITTEEREEIKQKIIDRDLLKVFSKYKWDLGKNTNIEPFKIKIKNLDECAIEREYELNTVDTKAFFEEIEYLINHKCAHWQTNDEIVSHAAPGFIVHHEVGELSDGSILVKSRLAVDFTKLNANTYKLNINLGKTLEDFLYSLSKYRYYNYFDITKYFYSIKMHEDSKQFVGMNTKKGVLIFDSLPTGLKNAPIYGQKVTTEAFKGTDVIPMQDDCFGGAITKEQCIDNFLNALSIAADIGLKISSKDIGCCVNEVKATGYKVNNKGIRPLPKLTTKALNTDINKIKIYKDWEVYRGFLEVLNNYIPKLAISVKLITNELLNPTELDKIQKSTKSPSEKRRSKEKMESNWTDEAIEYVEKVNNQIQNIPLLHHIIVAADAGPLLVKVDASRDGIGASLWQLRIKTYVLCKVRSKALSPTQQNYSASERERYGIIMALTWYGKYLRSKVFTLICDHKPLENLFNVAISTKNKKLLRWRALINDFQFIFDWKQRDSSSIKLEDYLSKLVKHPNENEDKYKKDGVNIELKQEESEEIKQMVLECNNNKKGVKNIDYIKKIYGVKTLGIEEEQEFNEKDEYLLYKYPSYGIRYKNGELINEKYGISDIMDISLLKEPSESIKQKLIEQKCEQNILLSNIAKIYKTELQHESLLNMKKYTELTKEEYEDYVNYIESLEILRNMNDNKMYSKQQYNINEQNKLYILDPNYLNEIKDNNLLINKSLESDLNKYKKQNTKLNKEENANINVMTRAQHKILEEKQKDNEQIPELQRFKGYLVDPQEEGNIFDKDKRDPIQILFDEQQKVYKNLLLYMVTKKKVYDKPALKTFNDIEYYKLVRDGHLIVNDEGLIVYIKDGIHRYLIPPSMRCSILIYYHTNPATGFHGNITQLKEICNKRFYWKGINEDIVRIVQQCICKTVKQCK